MTIRYVGILYSISKEKKFETMDNPVSMVQLLPF